MSSELWDEVAARMNAHGYMKDVERTVERVRRTGEVFTPTDLVLDMVRRMPLDQFAPGRTVLDPACGDGQFLMAAKWVKVLFHGMSEDAAVKELYGIDIMSDNVELCRRRLGGGTVLVGDALNPDRPVPGQTDDDLRTMAELFGYDSQAQTLFDVSEESAAKKPPMAPAMRPIASADLLAVGYDGDRAELWARFRTRPSLVYVYFDVPDVVYRQLCAAPSHGKFFHARIRDVYCVEKRHWPA